MDFLLQLDGNILLWIQEYLRSDLWTWLWVGITKLGDSGFIWLATAASMLFFKKTRKVGFVALLSIGLCFLITNVGLKNIVARPRPYTQIAELMILTHPESSFSFPSGHTANSFAVALIYYRMLPKKWGIAAVVLASLIGFSRLYIGVHYPSDVIGGFLVALFASSIVYWVYKKITAQSGKQAVIF